MIAGRPSATALAVLRSLVLLGRDPVRNKALTPDAIALHESFLRALDPAAAARWMRWSDRPIFRRTVGLAEAAFFPGLLRHFLARKNQVESVVRNALTQGVPQLVNLGAGYDTLCLRMARDFPASRCFELDHPSTQLWKRRCLEAAGIRPNLRLIPADFIADDAGGLLRACPDYDAGRMTIFVAEGLSMYLPESAVRNLFTSVATAGAAGSLLCFTFIEHSTSLGAPLLRLGLRLGGEPVRWTIRRENLHEFLAACGLRFEGITFPPEAAGAVQEYLAVASRT